MQSKTPFISLALVACLVSAPATRAQLEWRVSVKCFTGPAGALPRVPLWGSGGLFQSISNNVEWVNSLLDAHGRGYRWRLLEIVTVPGSSAPLPATTNSWFSLPVSPAAQDDLDGKAKANRATFQFRDNAINFYFVDSNISPNGGVCAFPAEGQDVILVAPNSFRDVLIHESGHFFGLKHTHNTEQYLNSDNTACTNRCACAQLIGGDDDIPDTPVDHQCWDQDGIATNIYGRVYAALDAAEQNFVNNSWSNIMSYHSPGNRFTSDQLDLMTDFSNSSRFNVASGRTYFVDLNCTADFPNGQSHCIASFGPFKRVADGIWVADPGDIVMLRPGHYNEPMTIYKAITLRAAGRSATIGRP